MAKSTSRCSHQECDRVLVPRKSAKGLCWNHYTQQRRATVRNFESICAGCGVEFAHYDRSTKCCSPACSQTVATKAATTPEVISRRSDSAAAIIRDGYLDKQCQLVGCETTIPWQSYKKYCSAKCRAYARSPLQAAINDWDFEKMVDALRDKVEIGGEFSCWLWPSLDEDGYPSRQLHRSVCEVKYGKPLGEQQAHHKCTVRACVRPDHLEPITHAQNMGEMFQRRSYLKRIDALEERLKYYNPNDELLNVIAFH